MTAMVAVRWHNQKEVAMRITDVSKLKGPLGELNNQLFGENGEERLAELNLWLKRVTVRVLKLVSTVHVCGAKRFIARGAFGKDNSAGIKFWLGDNFKNNFLEKIEKDVPAADLAVHALTKMFRDDSIRAELTSEHEETFLTHLYELIARQPNGEPGKLLTDGKANIFYIRDAKGVFWAVIACWNSAYREWYFSARSVSLPFEWAVGCQVFSQVSRS